MECKWEKEDDHEDCDEWVTQCDEMFTFTFGSPVDYFKFCPFCGKTLTT